MLIYLANTSEMKMPNYSFFFILAMAMIISVYVEHAPAYTRTSKPLLRLKYVAGSIPTLYVAF